MIDIKSYLSPDVIIRDLKAGTKEEAIRELIDIIFKNRPMAEYSLDREDVYQDVIRRENLQSTGIGGGVAVPHARIDKRCSFVMAMAVSKDGIDFKSVDGKPARFIFLMISSIKEPYIILQATSAIARLLTDMGLKKLLEDPQKLLKIFLDKKIETSEYVYAHHIAKPAETFLRLETPIEEAIRMICLKKEDPIPVVDGNNKFCGVLSSYDVFEIGIPDFFKRLHTVAFVKYHDPFEKYFKIKKGFKVKDVFKKSADRIDKNTTLMEIIFEMTVKHRRKIFVTEDDGTLYGVIDRFSIADRLLFF